MYKTTISYILIVNTFSKRKKIVIWYEFHFYCFIAILLSTTIQISGKSRAFRMFKKQLLLIYMVLCCCSNKTAHIENYKELLRIYTRKTENQQFKWHIIIDRNVVLQRIRTRIFRPYDKICLSFFMIYQLSSASLIYMCCLLKSLPTFL